MKKQILVTIMALGLTQMAAAKNGGANPDKLIIQNSAAGFLAESLESSLRLLSNMNQAQLDQVQDASLASITADQSKVSLFMKDTSVIVFNCIKFVDFSNGGTVLKNEASCIIQ